MIFLYRRSKFEYFYNRKYFIKQKAILFVEHDDEGDWFFLESEEVEEEDIIMSTMAKIVEIDQSVNGLYALNFNQYATRDHIDQEWIIE